MALKYDVDSVTWSPQGKLQQLEYAMETIKQGSVCLAIKSETEAVLISVKKNPTKWACYQEKLFKISDSIGVGISGMTGDARILCKYMRIANAQHQITYSKNISCNYLASKVSNKYQTKTSTYGKRPFGVGLLLIGFDDSLKPKLFEIVPSGESTEYNCWAIGGKSQSSKTYLEKYLDHFKKSSLDELVLHALNAIKSGYRDEPEEMTVKNIEVSVLKQTSLGGLQQLKEEELAKYLEKLKAFNPDNKMILEQKQNDINYSQLFFSLL